MSIETLAFGALHMLTRFYPKAAPVVAAVEKYKDAAPIIVNLIREGPSAFEAAKEKAPGLTAAIEQFVHAHMPATAQTAPNATALMVENTTRNLFGFGNLTHEQEMAWMERYSPISQDSRSGSG